MEEIALEPEASGESCCGTRRRWGKLLWSEKPLEKATLELGVFGGSCPGIRSLWGLGFRVWGHWSLEKGEAQVTYRSKPSSHRSGFSWVALGLGLGLAELRWVYVWV